MAAKTCPNCDLVHPASATRCECGYDFDEEKLDRSVHRPEKALEWHQEPIVAILSLLVCWPAGLVLISQNKHMSDGIKTLVVAVWLGLAGGALIYRLSSASRGETTP